jgi:uncharacterized protein (DUF697 family)
MAESTSTLTEQLKTALQPPEAGLSIEQQVHTIIRRYAFICGVAACQPIPTADAPILTAIEIIMCSRLARIRGFAWTRSSYLEILRQVGMVVLGGQAAKYAILTAYKFLLPGPANWFVTFPTVFAATYTLGMVFDHYFVARQHGTSPLITRDLLAKFRDEAKLAADEALSDLKRAQSFGVQQLQEAYQTIKTALTGKMPPVERPRVPITDDVMVGGVMGALYAEEWDLLHDSQSQLVLDALRCSSPRLRYASVTGLSDYLAQYDEAGLQSVINKVKGIYFKMAAAAAESVHGNAITASLPDGTDHAGYDLLLTNSETGETSELRLGAADLPAYVREAIESNPTMSTMTTGKEAQHVEAAVDSGIPFSEVEEWTEFVVSDLVDDTEVAKAVPVGVCASTALALLPSITALRSGRISRDDFKRQVIRITGLKALKAGGLIALMTTPAAPYVAGYVTTRLIFNLYRRSQEGG